MKRRIYLTLGWSLLAAIATFLNTWDLHIGLRLFFLPLFVFLAALGLFLYCLFTTCKIWKKSGWLSLSPFLILVLGYLLQQPVATLGIHLRTERFIRYLPEYEEMVGLIKANDLDELRKRDIEIHSGASPYMSMDLPDDLHHLGWGIRVTNDNKDGLTIVFVYAGGFGKHFLDYIYREDGEFEAVLEKVNMKMMQKINDNWCSARG